MEEDRSHRYELLARATRDIILFVRTDDGRILEANAAAVRAYGYTEEELHDLDIRDLRAPGARGATLQQLAEADAHGLSFETTHRRKDGTTFPVEVSAKGAELGGTRVVLSIVRDVTERSRFVDRLAAERERLDVTLRSIGDAVIATDATARITLMNTVAEQLTGWTTAEASGRPLGEVFRIVAEDTGEAVEDPVSRVLREGRLVGLANSTLLIARDGTVRPIADSGAPMRAASDATVGVVLVFRDQSEERRAERALRESESRLRAMFDQAGVGVALVETATNRFLDVNDRYCAMLGYTRDELLCRRWPELTHPEDLSVDVAGVRRMLETGQPHRNEKRFLRKDGTLLWASVTVNRVVLPGEATTSQVAVLEDITARKRAEEELQRSEARFQQAQKLESVGRLAGGVAHDFNNLLTVILSCADSLEAALASGQPASLEEVREIRAAGQRASELTRQLLAFARKQVIALVPIDLGVVVRESEKLLRRVLGEDVTLEVEAEPGLWLTRSDQGQLEQLILNLAVNARDAMPRGGSLRIETENVVLSARDAALVPGAAPGEHVRLRVRDAGCGMSEEVKAHLFEPFFTTKEPGRGTGLGLATVYGIVRQSGGAIQVQSAPGLGTTVEVLFPRTYQPPAPAPAPDHAAGGGEESILLVEDDPQVRAVAVRALRAAGYDVTAPDGSTAARTLGDDALGRFRLLITDVVMPGLDGRALAAELCRRNPGLRVLYVSGYTHDVIAERGLVDGGLEFLAKPFTAATLLTRVRAVLERRSPG